jgi:hypothetical protein
MIICLVKFDDKIFVMADADNQCIQGFKTIKNGLRFFEDAYNENHARSYEASMSACVNYIYFQPSIVYVKSYDELKKKIVDEKDFKVYDLRCVAGFMVGISTRPTAKEYWEKGHKPKLIDIEQAN